MSKSASKSVGKADALKLQFQKLAGLSIPSVRDHQQTIAQMHSAPPGATFAEDKANGPTELLNSGGGASVSKLDSVQNAQGERKHVSELVATLSDLDSIQVGQSDVTSRADLQGVEIGPSLSAESGPVSTLSEMDSVQNSHSSLSISSDLTEKIHSVKNGQSKNDALSAMEAKRQDESFEGIDRIERFSEVPESSRDISKLSRASGQTIRRSFMSCASDSPSVNPSREMNPKFPGKLKENYCGIRNEVFVKPGLFEGPVDFMVYCFLYYWSYGRGNRTATVADREIEEFTGCSKNTVKRALARLIASGWIALFSPPEVGRVKTSWYVHFFQDGTPVVPGPGEGGTRDSVQGAVVRVAGVPESRDGKGFLAAGGVREINLGAFSKSASGATMSKKDTVQNTHCLEMIASVSNLHTHTVSKNDPFLIKEEKKVSCMHARGDAQEKRRIESGVKVNASLGVSEKSHPIVSATGSEAGSKLARYVSSLSDWKQAREMRALRTLQNNLSDDLIAEGLEILLLRGMPETGVMCEFPLCFFVKQRAELVAVIEADRRGKLTARETSEARAAGQLEAEKLAEAGYEEKRQRFQNAFANASERLAIVTKLAPEVLSFGLEHPLVEAMAVQRWAG